MVSQTLFEIFLISSSNGSFVYNQYVDNSIQTSLGSLVLRLRLGLHPALARRVYVDTETRQRRREEGRFLGDLFMTVENHQPHGRVRLL